MSERPGFRWDARSLLWAAVVLGASAAFALLIARPQMRRARELAGTVRTERAQMSAKYQSLEAIARAQKDAAALSARAADFE